MYNVFIIIDVFRVHFSCLINQKKILFLRVLMTELLNRDNGDLFHGFNGGGTVTGATNKGNSGGSSTSNDDGDFWGMIFKGSTSNQASPPSPSSSIVFVSIFLSLLIIFILDITTNHVILLSSL